MEKFRKLAPGWKQDKNDDRDKTYLKVINESELPTSVDLQPFCPPVYDQGQIGSCTANALAAAIEFDQIKQKKTNAYTPSRLFIYYNERDIEGDIEGDNGAQIRDGIKTLSSLGVCPESDWAYDINNLTIKPSDSCYIDAKKELIESYERLDNSQLNQLKSCLSEGYPFVFGFQVYECFESREVAQTGILKMPEPGEQLVGGHAILACGFSDEKKAFKIRNSWGSEWGLQGYFWMPYEYITNTSLSSDFWKITFVE